MFSCLRVIENGQTFLGNRKITVNADQGLRSGVAGNSVRRVAPTEIYALNSLITVRGWRAG